MNSNLNKPPHLRATMIDVEVPADEVAFVGVNRTNKLHPEKAPKPVVELTLGGSGLGAVMGEFGKHDSHVYGQ